MRFTHCLGHGPTLKVLAYLGQSSWIPVKWTRPINPLACAWCPEYNGWAGCFGEHGSPSQSNWNKWTANPDGRVIVHMEIGLPSSHQPPIATRGTISLRGGGRERLHVKKEIARWETCGERESSPHSPTSCFIPNNAACSAYPFPRWRWRENKG